MVGRDPARSGPAGPPQEVRGRGTPMDCPRSHGKAVDCAARTGVGRGRAAPSPPAHSLSTGPQGAPALRACPQASHILGRWLETASRSPHFLLPSGSISIKLRPFAGPRRALRCGSRFVHSFLKVFSPPGGPGKWGADQWSRGWTKGERTDNGSRFRLCGIYNCGCGNRIEFQTNG